MQQQIDDFAVMCFQFIAYGGGVALLVFAVGAAADTIKDFCLGHRESDPD